MYEAVRTTPGGPSTLARLAATAADYGYEGLVRLAPPDDGPSPETAPIADRYGIDVVDGIALQATTPAEASGAIGHHRPDTTILSVEGGGNGLNAYAVRQSKVDVLLGPMAADGDLDHVLVKAAAEHGVRLAIDLGPVLRSTGDARTEALAGLRKLRDLLEAYDAPFVVTASPAIHLELRAPRELAAVAAAAGFDRTAVETGLSEWGRIASRNRERRSADYITPGVRLEEGADE